ncbi:Methyltransferase type 11 (plasmid) [Rhizorhabdus wittichii RW1]|uniref:Methyltransferase type 11 n=1 Tax=Rhizorhabdus wittichii (strain DSM 6014 / CCUG 31198 / JCM 15750 / NBRC 105917 / EY 4224 / RW1) TaxID=392499 RepID=A0A9J9HH20_RHIWR|nr:class I SAM-dependent methyltransferase [Sphingobium sp. LB126]ABQ71662.1 Methyltransferase type 11 [Rhizorhabdus wittichii RW1]PJG45539.1 SAM-dependent methyltransferase [Sphingobium sp. LB126]
MTSASSQSPSPMQRIWSLGDYHRIAVEHQIVSELLVANMDVRANQQVLDIACGTGNSAIAAARRRAVVTGIDIAPPLLERARLRSEAEGLDSITYDHGDAIQGLPYDDGRFDVVLSTLGLSFFPDHQQSIDECLRVLRPGGKIGIVAWAEPSMPTEFYHLGRDNNAIPEGRHINPAYYITRGPYLANIVGDRVSDVRIRQSNFEATYATIDDYLDLGTQFHGPTIARFASLQDDAQRAEYRQKQYEILERYNRAVDGTFALSYDYTEIILVKR